MIQKRKLAAKASYLSRVAVGYPLSQCCQTRVWDYSHDIFKTEIVLIPHKKLKKKKKGQDWLHFSCWRQIWLPQGESRLTTAKPRGIRGKLASEIALANRSWSLIYSMSTLHFCKSVIPHSMSHDKELQTLEIWLMLPTILFSETAISDFNWSKNYSI